MGHEIRQVKILAASGAEIVAETMQPEAEGIPGVSMGNRDWFEQIKGVRNGAKFHFLGL